MENTREMEKISISLIWIIYSPYYKETMKEPIMLFLF